MKNIALFLLISFLTISTCNSQSVRKLIKRGIEKTTLKDYKGALIEFDKAICKDSNSVTAY
jgi:hypothetical protein